MLIDSGFSVDNYVGTYHLELDKELGRWMIISAESSCPGPGEAPLLQKRVMDYDRGETQNCLSDFLNIDLDQDSSILAFCNRYGLPYSSQRAVMLMGFFGQEVDEELKWRYACANPQVHATRDCMDVDRFCNMVLIVRNLVRLSALVVEEKLTDALYTEWVSVLLYFSFFSHKDEFNFDDERDHPPRAQLMRFQYYWQFALQKSDSSKTPLFRKLIYFLHNGASGMKQATTRITADFTSPEFQRLISFFLWFFQVSKANRSFGFDRYGFVKFYQELNYDGSPETLETLRQISLDVIMAVINVGLEFVAPTMETANGTLRGGWRMNFLMNAIYMKLFLEIAQNHLYRQCANPTCQRLFPAAENRPNKIYCCRRCAEAMAKRSQRARKKAAEQQQGGPRGELP